MSMAQTIDQPQTQNGTGQTTRVRVDGLPDAERNYAMAIHLTPFAALMFQPAILVPLVLWLVKKDDSAFNDDHGREVVNVLISAVIFTFVAGALFIAVLPILAIMVWYVVIGINMIRGAMAASRGEYFRYPMTLRILS